MAPQDHPVASDGSAPTTDWLHPPAEQQGLKRYVETIRERIWLIVLAVVATTGVAIAYLATAEQVYEAQADILVSPVPDEAETLVSLGLIRESNDPLRAVETAAALIESRDAADRARRELGLESNPDAVLRRITAEPVAESNIVTVTAEGSSPEAAAQLANAFSEATIRQRTDLLHDRIDQELPTLQARLDETGPGPTRDALAAQIAQLESFRAGSDPTLQLEATATEPGSAVSPQPVPTIVAGILGGFVLGVGGAFAFQVLDPRLRREEQLRSRYRLPILARVPNESGRGDEPLPWERLSAGSIEAYRTLRAVATRSSGARSILVTSPGPAEGKTTTAINLATSLTLAGSSVVLIEADLRRPSIGRALGVPVDKGVVSTLLEETSLQDSLVTAPGYDYNLRLLLAEHTEGSVEEIFSLPTAQRLVDEAGMLADFVIVDSPPLATVVDALPLARTVDELVIVVKLGASRLHRIHELAELLADTGLRPAGFAVIGVPRAREPYYGEYRRRGARKEPELPLPARSD